MAEKQKTLSESIQLKGYGLHTGKEVEIKICPADCNTGYVFKRTDIDGHPLIYARAENVTTTDRGTSIEENNIKIWTIEHLLASLYGMDVDNAVIELNGPEIPIMDGSAKYYTQAIKSVGLIKQDAERRYFIPKEKIEYRNDEKGIEITIYPDDKLSIDVHIDYNSKYLGFQYASLKNITDFEKEIAPCRTFVFLHELEALLNNNLIKGGDLDNAIVIIDKNISQEELDRLAELFNKPKIKVKPEGILNNLEPYFDNEPARHKLLDIVGDLALTGRRIKGKIIAKKPGHQGNTELAKKIRKIIKHEDLKPVPPNYNPNEEPLFNINQIQEWLPHRPPFLLVDKITYMDKWVVTGIKNVTMNEAFFVGHFPEEPIMPGVLQVEAMAQCGGMLLLSLVEDNPSDYLLIFIKIEKVRFKQKVVPGDTLNMRMKLLEPVKRGIAYTKGEAFVGDKIVAECEFMAQMTKKPGRE